MIWCRRIPWVKFEPYEQRKPSDSDSLALLQLLQLSKAMETIIML